MKKLFDTHDADNSGSIDEHELMPLLQELGHPMQKDQAHDLVAQVDINGNGLLEFSIEEIKAKKKNKNKLIIPRVAHKHIINNLMGMCLGMGEQLMNTDAAKILTHSNQVDFIPPDKKNK